MNKIGVLAEVVEETLLQEKEKLKEHIYDDADMHNCKGWVEALQYVLRQIEVIVE